MDSTNTHLMKQLSHLVALLHHRQILRYHDHGLLGDPHRGQGRVLSLLNMQPHISQKELSYLLDMRPQSLGELLGKLEQKGYITRSCSSKDKRVMEIQLTETGKNTARMVKKSQEAEYDLFECLNPDELKHFCDYLDRINQALTLELEKNGYEKPDFKKINSFPYHTKN